MKKLCSWSNGHLDVLCESEPVQYRVWRCILLPNNGENSLCFINDGTFTEGLICV